MAYPLRSGKLKMRPALAGAGTRRRAISARRRFWEWARAAGLTTAAVSWPVTAGVRIDLLMPERDYYVQKNPLERLQAESTVGICRRLGVTPSQIRVGLPDHGQCRLGQERPTSLNISGF